MKPSLTDAIKAMKLTGMGGTRDKAYHRATNDAVRCLALLSGLVSPDCVVIDKVQQTVLFSSIPPRTIRQPFTARITTVNGDSLPSEVHSPRSLSKLFAKYEPKAVAINSHCIAKSQGLKVWWISFLSMEALNRFTAEIDGSVLGERQLAVEEIVIDPDWWKSR